MTDSERQAQHADGIIDRMAADPDAEPERWRAVQEAMRFCSVRTGFRLDFVAANGAPFVQGHGRAVSFRDDTGTWDFHGARVLRRNLTDAVRAAGGADAPDEKWTDEERLGTTPELLALSESTCDCAAREDGGQGHDPDCSFYVAVAVHFGQNHPLVVGAWGV